MFLCVEEETYDFFAKSEPRWTVTDVFRRWASSSIRKGMTPLVIEPDRALIKVG
jgi:hypothetical protein